MKHILLLKNSGLSPDMKPSCWHFTECRY